MPNYRIPPPGSPDADYAAFTKNLWTDLDGWYGFWVKRWQIVMDFLRSQHWNMLKVIEMNQIPDWKKFPVMNMTLAMYSDYLKEWLQSRVRFSAIPDSAQMEDIEAAEIGDYTLRYLWDVMTVEDKRLDLGAWLMATGNADARVRYVETGDVAPLLAQLPTGEMVPANPETGEPDPNLQEPVMVPDGEMALDIMSPQFTRYPLSTAHGVMSGQLVSYDEALDLYGEEVAESLHYTKGDTWGSLSIDLLTPTQPYTPVQRDEVALVVEHYLPPSKRYKKGLLWTASGNKLIKAEDEETATRELPTKFIPVVHFRWIPLPGHPTFGLTPLFDVTLLNKNYDEALAKTQEWVKKVVPKTLLKQGGGIIPGDLTEEAGQELQIPEGLEPEYLVPPPPPPELERIRNESQEGALFVGGYRFMRGQDIPAGETTQRTRKPPRVLNEGEPVALAQIASKASWEALGYVLLAYAGTFYHDGKVASIAGQDRTYQWRSLKTSALQDLRARLRVDEIPLYTWNRQSMKDAVIGILSTPAGQILFAGPDGQLDRQRVDAAINAVGLDTHLPFTDPDVVEARNEIHVIRNMPEDAEPLERMPWQNSETHLQEKLKEVKSIAFKGWPKHAQEAMMANIQAHEQAIAESNQAQVQAELDQERQLRDIRASSETAQDVRTALGEMLIERVGKMLDAVALNESPESEE